MACTNGQKGRKFIDQFDPTNPSRFLFNVRCQSVRATQLMRCFEQMLGWKTPHTTGSLDLLTQVISPRFVARRRSLEKPIRTGAAACRRSRALPSLEAGMTWLPEAVHHAKSQKKSVAEWSEILVERK
ncbi:hypothetical protein ATY78_01285 [Rhizobium sp. R635]|nr:hypothetical protein ATY78_01285 [Rhizobium sp. R635]